MSGYQLSIDVEWFCILFLCSLLFLYTDTLLNPSIIVLFFLLTFRRETNHQSYSDVKAHISHLCFFTVVRRHDHTCVLTKIYLAVERFDPKQLLFKCYHTIGWLQINVSWSNHFLFLFTMCFLFTQIARSSQQTSDRSGQYGNDDGQHRFIAATMLLNCNIDVVKRRYRPS